MKERERKRKRGGKGRERRGASNLCNKKNAPNVDVSRPVLFSALIFFIFSANFKGVTGTPWSAAPFLSFLNVTLQVSTVAMLPSS